MQMMRILVLCLTAALICASIRSVHPQIATAVALGCGAAAMLISVQDLGAFADSIRKLEALGSGQGLPLLKLCGVALVAEFASDVCRDAGEVALSRRIDVGVKLGLAASALPAAGQIMDRIAELMA